MTIDKQIVEALEDIKQAHEEDDVGSWLQCAGHDTLIIACLQAILEAQFMSDPIHCKGGEAIKTRVKELLESSADVKEQSFN